MVYVYGGNGVQIWGLQCTSMGSKVYSYGVKVYVYGELASYSGLDHKKPPRPVNGRKQSL